MDLNQLADGLISKYLRHGYPAVVSELDTVCRTKGIEGWSKRFLVAKVRSGLSQNHPAAYRDFMADARGIDKKKAKR